MSGEYRTVTGDDGQQLTPTAVVPAMTWTTLPGVGVDVLAPAEVVLSYRPTPETVELTEAWQRWTECTCVEYCDQACSLNGTPHVHPDDGSGTFGPCPVHPDRPGDR